MHSSRSNKVNEPLNFVRDDAAAIASRGEEVFRFQRAKLSAHIFEPAAAKGKISAQPSGVAGQVMNFRHISRIRRRVVVFWDADNVLMPFAEEAPKIILAVPPFAIASDPLCNRCSYNSSTAAEKATNRSGPIDVRHSLRWEIGVAKANDASNELRAGSA